MKPSSLSLFPLVFFLGSQAAHAVTYTIEVPAAGSLAGQYGNSAFIVNGLPPSHNSSLVAFDGSDVTLGVFGGTVPFQGGQPFTVRLGSQPGSALGAVLQSTTAQFGLTLTTSGCSGSQKKIVVNGTLPTGLTISKVALVTFCSNSATQFYSSATGTTAPVNTCAFLASTICTPPLGGTAYGPAAAALDSTGALEFSSSF